MADANAYNALLGDYGDPSYWRTPMRQPNALYDGGPVWENNHAAPVQQRQRPADWSVTSGIAEAISPTMGAYGMGAGVGQTYNALSRGDYAGAAEAGLPLAAMALMPGPKGMGKLPAAAEQPKGIRAYHGSPHDFNQFDISKIGTGEGAQAYGHGLYFAEQEATAKSYRNNLSGTDSSPYLVNGKPVSGKMETVLDAYRARGENWDAVRHDIDPAYLPELDYLQKQKVDIPTKGRMYEVNIKADPGQFIEHEKRLSEHPRNVQDLLAGWRNTQLYRNYDRLGIKDPSAGGAFSALSKEDPVGWSQKAAEAGIPGIRYLDQGSRGAGEGSRNYVVFDPATIEILRKYGLLGPMAGGVGVNALYGSENQ